MKKRIISAIVALIIVVPLIILGNYFFAFGVCVIAMLAYKELIDLKKAHNEYPKLMITLGLLSMLSLVLSNYQDFTMDPNEVTAIVIVNAKDTLELFQKENGIIEGKEITLENEIIERNIDFKEFLVNEGETALEKYGEVLKKVIELTKSY